MNLLLVLYLFLYLYHMCYISLRMCSKWDSIESTENRMLMVVDADFPKVTAQTIG